MDKLLSIGQVAKRLGVSVDVVRSLEERGELKARRTPGGHRRYLPADVDRLNGRQRAGRSRTQSRSSRKPAPRRPSPAVEARRPAEPDYDAFDVEEDVLTMDALKAEAEREAAKQQAAVEAKARAAAADAEQQRLEGLKKYGRELAFYSLPAEWAARVVEDLEEFVTPKRVPSSLAPRQAQEIVGARVNNFKEQYHDEEDKRRKQEDDARRIEWLTAWGKSYAVSATNGVNWGSAEQDRARREVETELKHKVKADMSEGNVKDLVEDVLNRWEDPEDDDEDYDYEDGDDAEDEDDEDDEEEDDESEW